MLLAFGGRQTLAFRSATRFTRCPSPFPGLMMTGSYGTKRIFPLQAESPSSTGGDFLEKHEFIQRQASVSGQLRSSENSGPSTLDKQEFLALQAKTFDEMAPIFAEKETIPEHLFPVYQTLAAKILEPLIQERQRAAEERTANESNNDSYTDGEALDTPSSKQPFRILDVAAGTGALWPFWMDYAQRHGMTLDIQAVDLAPRMVELAQIHAEKLLATYPLHAIRVECGDIMQYMSSSDDGNTNEEGSNIQDESEDESATAKLYDAVICNACWANFYSPPDLLKHIADNLLQSHNSAADNMFGQLFITHPLGPGFIQDLHEADPQTVPHLLPDSWSPTDLIGLPLSVQEFIPQQVDVLPYMTKAQKEESNTENAKDKLLEPFYFARLQRVRYALLPEAWRFRGPVARGYGRGGKKLGFPTANLVASAFFQNALQDLATGVYIGWARVESGDAHDSLVHRAVVNVGYSPTFEGKENPEKIIEAHLMPDEGVSMSDFYEKTMRLELLAYLRPEQKFGSFPELIAQINADANDAKQALGAHPVLQSARSDPFFSELDWQSTSNMDVGSTAEGDNNELSLTSVSSFERQAMNECIANL